MYLALFFTLIDARRMSFWVTRVIDAFGILHISFASSTSPVTAFLIQRHSAQNVCINKKTRIASGFSSD